MENLNYKTEQPILFQDMSVGGDLDLPSIFVIEDSPTWQRIAIQIIKIGIPLLQYRSTTRSAGEDTPGQGRKI